MWITGSRAALLRLAAEPSMTSRYDGVLMVGLPLLRENFTLSLVVALEVCSHVAGDPIQSLELRRGRRLLVLTMDGELHGGRRSLDSGAWLERRWTSAPASARHGEQEVHVV